MKIVDYVTKQSDCYNCILSEPRMGDSVVWCPIKDRLVDQDVSDTCGAWYLELTRPANPELIGDREHKVIHVYDFPSWVNLYQAPRVPQIRVLSRDEWPEATDD